MFDIPIVFFIFRRPEKSVEILKQIGKVKPKKLYIIADAGRNDEEREDVNKCRAAVEQSIDWDCEVIKNYAEENRGCFDRIGLGALWVFEREERAIFLEDDNFPEISFFQYCKEMLEKYERDDRILWVCGTNYLEEYSPKDGSDYVFTQHMLPCGWASWSTKFRKYYDAEFANFDRDNIAKIQKRYRNKRVFRRDFRNWKMEVDNKRDKGRYCSWDYQMCFSLRMYNKLGIVPKYNQIRNIGVDAVSEHGGTTFESIMTQRFCGMGAKQLSFPLTHPKEVTIDNQFDALIDKIVLPPIEPKAILRRTTSKLVRKVLRIPDDQKVRDFLVYSPKRGMK